jgi:hypothetical protein
MSRFRPGDRVLISRASPPLNQFEWIGLPGVVRDLSELPAKTRDRFANLTRPTTGGAHIVFEPLADRPDTCTRDPFWWPESDTIHEAPIDLDNRELVELWLDGGDG